MRTSQDIGKSFEKTLEGVFSSIQKTHAFRIHKFVDSHAAGNIVASQPSDYLIGTLGQMMFLEAKASTKNKRMTRAALRPAQRGAIHIFSQVLNIPYYVLFFAEKTGTVHLLDGAMLMKGGRTNYSLALMKEVAIEQLEELLIERLDLTPLPTALKKYNLLYGEE